MAAVRPGPAPAGPATSRDRPGERPIIVAEQVEKRFGDTVAVRDLTLTVRSGVICGLVGPSGSGKTTAVRLLNGYYAPTRGRLRVLGVDPLRYGGRERRQIGYLPQHFALYPELSVLENLNFAASLYGLSLFGRAKRLRALLELVGLWEHRHRAAGELSGGMKRRLMLASSFFHEPRLLFLDEPTAGIDPMLRATFWDEFRRLRDSGRTLFVTTQYVTEAEYCDQVAVMDRGAVVAVGSPAELRRRAQGGEELALQASGLTRSDLERLERLPGTRQVWQVGPDEYHLVVEDAGTAMPDVLEALRADGREVQALRPHRPSFDDVFRQIIEQARAEQEG